MLNDDAFIPPEQEWCENPYCRSCKKHTHEHNGLMMYCGILPTAYIFGSKQLTVDKDGKFSCTEYDPRDVENACSRH